MTDELEPARAEAMARLRQELIECGAIKAEGQGEVLSVLRLDPPVPMLRLDDDTRARLAKRFGRAA